MIPESLAHLMLEKKHETYLVPPLSKLGLEPFQMDPMDFYQTKKIKKTN